jgi:hypothetical protein
MEESSVSAAADRTSRKADQLQTAADILMVKRRRVFIRVLKLAVGAVILMEGLLGLGLGGQQTSEPDTLLALIGAILLLDGAWSLVNLTPGAMLMTACTAVVVGVWAITLNPDDGIQFNLRTIIGAILIGVGYWHVRQYQAYLRLYRRKPDEETIGQADKVITQFEEKKEAAEPKEEESRDAGIRIVFTISTLPGETPWVGDLSGPVAFLYHAMTGKLVCASPRQFGIGEEDSEGVTPVRMRGRTYAGIVDHKARSVYKAWIERNREETLQ